MERNEEEQECGNCIQILLYEKNPYLIKGEETVKNTENRSYRMSIRKQRVHGIIVAALHQSIEQEWN